MHQSLDLSPRLSGHDRKDRQGCENHRRFAIAILRMPRAAGKLKR
jgi:hypothetical protein